MSVEELLATTQRQGIELWLDGERLHYKAANKVSEEIKARLRGHKGEIIRILKGRAAVAREEQKIQPWCSIDCAHFDPAELPGRAPVPGCFREIDRGGWVWSRLDKLNACPVIPEGLPPLPAWCSRQCRHYHATQSGAVLIERCHWQDKTGRHWVRIRIEQLRRCPMKAHKNSSKNK